MVGLAGNDTLTSGGGSGDKLEGGDGDDVLDGSQSPNASLIGGAGNDKLISGFGATLDGGAGTDIVSYEKSDVGVTLNLADATENEDQAEGNTFTNIEQYNGSPFDDTLIGDSNANKLMGRGGNDTLEGGAGSDTLNGGAGADTLSYAGSSNAVTVSLNNNTVSGGDAAGDTISNFENITGSANGDSLTGDANANVVKGGEGADTITSGGGNDKLAPGDADDTVSAGAGTDEFFFHSSFDNDTISDYASGEKIWICIGSGKGTGNGQVTWSSTADSSDWDITVTLKNNSGTNVQQGVITLTGVSSDPGSDIAWSDPDAVSGVGCNF